METYRDAIDLDRPWSSTPDPDWRSTIAEALRDVGEAPPDGLPAEAALHLLRGRLAGVEPFALPAPVMDRIEAIYAAVSHERGTRSMASTETLDNAPWFAERPDIGRRLSLIVGNITDFEVDAIANAANGQLLGCRIPNHRCIDNAIHSAAGPRLRDDCATIMAGQRHLEPIGQAKVTRAYALPSRFVLHTVGPQLVPGFAPTPQEQAALSGCYRSCLNVAASVGSIRSVAICGISTGAFAYPKQAAASVALSTVSDWLESNPDALDLVIINCFSREDANHYRRLLSRQRPISG